MDRGRLERNAHLTQPLALFDHYGACTRSDAEAMFDGYEHHFDLPAFRDDRVRGGSYRRAGYELIRFAADQVRDDGAEVAATLQSARPRLATAEG